jgi:hypothetical protein
MIDPKTRESKLTIDDIKSLEDLGSSYWSSIQAEATDDLRFSYATDKSQWDMASLQARGGRPVETYNIVNGFVRPVVNLARQNPPAINIFPVSDGASKTNARLISGVIRAIEYGCGAQREYCNALEMAVRGGYGVLRLIPKLSDIDDDDVEFLITSLADISNVLIDPSSNKSDYSDAQWIIIKSRMSERQYRREYPKGMSEGLDGIIEIKELWIREITIEKTRDEITNQETSKRTVKIMQYVYDDHAILDKVDTYPGKYLPFAIVSGSRYSTDDRIHLQSLTREIRGVQKEINFLKSESIASIACAPKNTYTGDNDALDVSELKAWEESATSPRVFLGHKPGATIKREEMPQIPSAYLESADKNIDIARVITGIYPDPTVQNGLNPVSGKAIKQQQAGQAIATYTFIDSLNYAIKHIAEILLDLLPFYYNDDKIRLSMGVDGKYTSVSMGPQDVEGADNFDLAYGKYNVSISSGPSYASQKDALIEMVMDAVKQNPQAMSVALPWIINQINLPGSEELSDMFALLLPEPIQQFIAQNKAGSQSPEDKLKAAIMQLQKLADDNKTKGDMIDKLTDALQTESAQLKSKQDELAQQKQIADDKNHMALIIADLNMQHEKAIEEIRARTEAYKASLTASTKRETNETQLEIQAQESADVHARLDHEHANNVEHMLIDKATTPPPTTTKPRT